MILRHLFTATLFGVITSFGAVADGIGDPKKGAKVFKKCKACHQVGEGAKHRVGPQLNGLFGRTAGTLEGFKYSKAMTTAGEDGLVWTDETIAEFVENPKTFIPKSKMSFKGLKKEKDRVNLLAYLQTFSDNPEAVIIEEVDADTTDGPALDAAVLALVGDAEYGEYLSGDCKTCHQTSGGDDGIPSIVGWPTEDFVIAMHSYKQKRRPHPVMQMMAGRLSDEEIAGLAAYFNALQ